MGKYVAKQPDKRGFIHFTAEENETWQILISRQMKVIQQRACNEFIAGLKKLDLPMDRVPQCQELTETLKATTGWSVVPVAAMISLEAFFKLLANRQFPAASFIRIREELDYLQEPDIFHEFFGHCPLLTHQGYADFVQWYGETALKTPKAVQSLLGRLFWFTVEFGLVQSSEGVRIYGGGILSSYEETVYAVESDIPKRLDFNLMEVLQTPYRYDVIQDRYFVLNDLQALFKLKTDEIVQYAEKLSKDGTQDNDFVIC